MITDRRRLILALILNIIMMILFISSIIIEIIDIHNNPNSVYITVWGLFRYFTIDGNIFSFIFTTIMAVKQIKAIRKPKTEDIKPIIISNLLYLGSLMSACIDLVIFVVVVFIFLPMSANDSTWALALVGSYNVLVSI